MGTERMQPLTLICNYPEGKLYTLQADLTGLKILDVEVGLDWALLIALNRDVLPEPSQEEKLLAEIRDLLKERTNDG